MHNFIKGCIRFGDPERIYRTEKREFSLQLDGSVSGPVLIKVDDSPHAVRTKIEQLTSVNKVW